MPQQVDVAIVGGGMIGLALATYLSGSGAQVAVFDQAEEPVYSPGPAPVRTGSQLVSGIAPRVSALGVRTIQDLAEAGAWPHVPENAQAPFRAMEVCDAEGTGSVRFDASDIGADSLGSVVANAATAHALVASLEGTDCALNWETPVTGLSKNEEGYLISSGEAEWETPLLVGADGAASRVRELTRLSSLRWSYDASALVTTVEIDGVHDNVARQWFTPMGILAYLPLAQKNLVSIVFSSKQVDSLLEMDDERFCRTLDELTDANPASVLATDQRFSFPLIQQHSLRYVQSGLALIGDAAHTIHPLAGQGANLGFADAKTLARVVTQAIREQRSPGELNLLRQYQRQRQPDNVLTGMVMEAFARGYGSNNPAVSWLRNQGMRFVDNTAGIKSLLIRLATAR